MRLTIFTTIMFSFFFCNDSPAQKMESAGYLDNEICKIVQISDWYVLVPIAENKNKKRYAPKLDKVYQIDGLHVKVSGTIGKIPPNVKMIGHPLSIDRIEVVKIKDLPQSYRKTIADEQKTVSSPPKQSPPKTNASKKTNDSSSNSSVASKINRAMQANRTKKVENVKAKVIKVADTFLLEDKQGKRYLPKNLAEKFQIIGRKVTFSGKEGSIPPNVKMLGVPLEITDIKKRCLF